MVVKLLDELFEKTKNLVMIKICKFQVKVIAIKVSRFLHKSY